MQNSWIDIIKEKLTIREVIEHYCGRAVRNKVKSPFKVEKTASLHIYDNTQRFVDFSSGESGDIFNFVEKLFNCNNTQACKIISNDFGIELSGYKKLDDTELEKKRLAREKRKIEKAFREQKLFELLNQILDHLKMFEQIKEDTKPYSVKNLGGYRYSKDCDLHIWAVKNLERLNYLYSAVGNLQVEDIQKDLEFVNFYAYGKEEQNKRQQVLLDKYLAGQLDLIV